MKAVLIGPPPENRVLGKKFGVSYDHPSTVKDPNSPEYYPSFIIIRIEGIEEVIEHKKMEPIYYVSDELII